MAVSGADRLQGTANYFIGNDPADWHSAVPTFGKVKYAGVYPGVDLVYYGNQQQLEYDFVVAPGADPKQVKLHFAGAEKLKINANGDLTVAAEHGEIAFHKPVVYQIISGQHRAVNGSFALLAKDTVGFTLGSYDRTREVVIDPTLAYSTYFGGQSHPMGITADAAGNVYITGGLGLSATTGAYQSKDGYFAIAKLNPQGSGLAYVALLGGSGAASEVYAIAIDPSGDAYVTGQTFAHDFPITPGAFQQTNRGLSNGGSNVFVTELNPTGTALVYSTYLGGSDVPNENGDVATSIAVDSVGNAYVTGAAFSADFPVTPGAFQATNRAGGSLLSNGFVTKLNATGTALEYSTYLGGHLYTGNFQKFGDYGSFIAVDSTGHAYVTGTTFSHSFPVTTGVIQETWPSNSLDVAAGFVTKFNPKGTGLAYSTYLPGNGSLSVGLAVDASNNVYVAGSAGSYFPISSNAFQKTGDGFVAKLNPGASAFVYSTLLGGFSDTVMSLAVDRSGDAFVAGIAGPAFPVTLDAFQLHQNYDENSFLAKIDPTGSALLYATYLGGRNTNENAFVAVDPAGNAYLTGNTDARSFPVTSGAFETSPPIINGQIYNGGYVAKFSFNPEGSNTIDFGQGFASAAGPVKLNGTAAIDASKLRLTDGKNYEKASAFYATPVNIQAFTTDFSFQLIDPSADGITFTIQNAGAAALGGFGSYGDGLGYANIGKSVALKFDLHNNAGEGINSTGLYLNGAVPTVPDLTLNGSGINLHSGDIFEAHLTYDGINLVLTVTDTVTSAAYTHSFALNIPTTVGGPTAYVGFTGATGMQTATQEILNWTFTNP